MSSGDFPLIVWESKSENYGAMGWICPICGRGLSPWVPECPHCQPSKSQGGVSTDKSHYYVPPDFPSAEELDSKTIFEGK